MSFNTDRDEILGVFEEEETPTDDEDGFIFLAEEKIEEFGGLVDPEAAGVLADQEITEAVETNRDRSSRARELDDEFTAPVTTDIEQWQADMMHWDFPGVDTTDDRFE